MKRFLAILLCVMLVCAPALADTVSIDPDQASLTELIALRDALNERILSLGGELPLEQGVYVVGDNLPAGAYRFIVGQEVESAFIYVYGAESENWYDFEHFYALGRFHGAFEVGRVELAEGSRVDIQGAPVAVVPIV